MKPVLNLGLLTLHETNDSSHWRVLALVLGQDLQNLFFILFPSSKSRNPKEMTFRF